MAEQGPPTVVHILGEEYSIRGASPEQVSLLARMVDEKFKNLKEARPSLDLKRLAVMVSLNIAEEILEEKARNLGLLEAVRERTRRCGDLLDGLAGGQGPPPPGTP